jgi:D-3-phosphoglycerate dehydrogenase
MAELVSLSRQLFERAFELRQGIWNKQSKAVGSYADKTLGIVGYGHIAHSLASLRNPSACECYFMTFVNLMPLGSAFVKLIPFLLYSPNRIFVTLHVPEVPETINMISWEELQHNEEGSLPSLTMLVEK